MDQLGLAEDMAVLMISGECDPLIPHHHGKNPHLASARSHLEMFDGVGHLSHPEAPDRFSAAFDRLVAENEPARLAPT